MKLFRFLTTGFFVATLSLGSIFSVSTSIAYAATAHTVPNKTNAPVPHVSKVSKPLTSQVASKTPAQIQAVALEAAVASGGSFATSLWNGLIGQTSKIFEPFFKLDVVGVQKVPVGLSGAPAGSSSAGFKNAGTITKVSGTAGSSQSSNTKTNVNAQVNANLQNLSARVSSLESRVNAFASSGLFSNSSANNFSGSASGPASTSTTIYNVYNSYVTNSGGGYSYSVPSNSANDQDITDAVNALSTTLNAKIDAINVSGTSQWTTLAGNIYFNTGNVGIGTTTPAEKLSVAGNANVTGDVNALGNITAAAFYGDGSHLTGVGAAASFSTSTTRGVFSATGPLTYSSSTGIFGIGTSTLGLRTSDVAENGNLYFTNSRAEASISSLATGLTYNNGNGQFSLTSGYVIPLTASTTEWANNLAAVSVLSASSTAFTNNIATLFASTTALSSSVNSLNTTVGALSASSTLFSSFYITPSNRITAGTNLSWSGNTLNGLSNAAIQNLLSAGSGLSYSSSTGTFTNTGVLSIGGLTGNVSTSSLGITSFSTSTTRSAFSATSPLSYDSANGIFGVAGGYTIPLTASTTEWANSLATTAQLTASSTLFSSFYLNPSTRISAGTGLSWSGNTLNSTGVTSIGGLTGAVSTSSLGIVGTQWGTSGSDLYYTAGNVGIGTNSPGTIFQVQKPGDATRSISFTMDDPMITFANGSEPAAQITSSYGSLQFARDYSTYFAINSAGQVGSVNGGPINSLPSFRNILDDGSGNASFTGSVAIGTTTAARKFDILDGSGDPQLRLAYDNSNFTDIGTNFAGDLNITPSGGDALLNGNLYLYSGGLSLKYLDDNVRIDRGSTGAVDNTLKLFGYSGISFFEPALSSTVPEMMLRGGNLGIGTSTPGSALTVVGDINLTGALRANGSAGSNGQILQTTGSGVQWIATSSLGIVSFSTTTTRNVFSSSATGLSYDNSTGIFSLTSGYAIPLTASTTEWASKVGSQWATNGSNISYAAGNVGIGTTSPAYALAVSGDINLTGALRANGSAGSNGQILQTTGSGLQWVATSSLGFSSGGTSSQWTTNGSSIYYNTGNIGIGSSTPGTKFTLVQTGTSNTDGLMIQDNGGRYGRIYQQAGNGLIFDDTDRLTFAAPLYASQGFTIAGANFDVQNSITNTGGNNNGAVGIADDLFISGNVGIGTSTPSSMLAVAGNITSTGTISLLGTGTSTIGGNVAISGSIIPTSPNTYSLGTASSTWKDIFVGPGSIYVNGQEVLHTDISQNVNITADPNQSLLLTTFGTGNIALNPSGGGQVQLQGNVSVSTGKNFSSTGGGPIGFTGGIAADNLTISSNTIKANNLNGGISIAATGTGGVYFTQGNVGIGTTSPAFALAITGDTNITGTIRANGSAGTSGQILQSTGSGMQWVATSSLGLVASGNANSAFTIGNGVIYNATSSDAVGIGTSTPRAKLDVYGTSGANDIFDVSSSTNSRLFVVTAAGNVGIGTTSPAYALAVSGDVNITGALRANGNAGTSGQILQSTGSGMQWVATSSLGISGGGASSQWTTSGSNIYYSTGNISVGTSTGSLAIVTIQGTSTSPTLNLLSVASSSGSQYFTVASNGNVGIGTSTPIATLSVTGSGATNPFAVASSTGSLMLALLPNGNFGIGTSTPYAALTVVGQAAADYFTAVSTTATSTFAGSFDVGNGSFDYNNSTGVTTLTAATLGNLSFDTNAGIVSWVDLPVTSAAIVGTIESYNANINGNPVLTIYGESNGSGGTQNLRVGVGSSTPIASLSVTGTGGYNPFVVASSTGNQMLTLAQNGSLGIGTSTPIASLALTGTAGVNPLVIASSTGAQLLTVLQNGSLGIGTSTPFAKLDVYGNAGSADAFDVSSSTNSRLFTVAANGNVGIGTSSPIAAFALNSGQISAPAAAVGNPSYAFNTDLTSGMYLPSSNNLAFTTGGTERFRISSNGDLSINATKKLFFNGAGDNANWFIGTDASYNLNVEGGQSGGTRAFQVMDGATARMSINFGSGAVSTSPSYFNLTGNLGIGTTTPIDTFSIKGVSGVDPFVIASSTNAIMLTLLQNGNFGIGTSTPGAALTVAGQAAADYFTAASTTATSTFNGGFVANNGLINSDWASGQTTIANLVTGAQTFDTDAGIVSWADMPVTASSSASTTESYTAQLGGNAVLTVYGQADGSGGVTSLAVGIGTTTPTLGPLVMASGAYVTTGGTWTNASDRNLKENFTAVDGEDILSKIGQLPITEWNYKSEATTTTHVGPMAQDFYSIFGLGGSNTSISTIDPAGLALVGIQAFDKDLRATTTQLELNQASGLTFAPTDGTSGDGSQTVVQIVSKSFIGRIINTLQYYGVKIQEGIAYFKNIVADKVTTKELCLQDVCVTRDQLQQMLEKANQVSTPSNPDPFPSSSGQGATSTPSGGNDSGDSNSNNSNTSTSTNSGDADAGSSTNSQTESSSSSGTSDTSLDNSGSTVDNSGGTTDGGSAGSTDSSSSSADTGASSGGDSGAGTGSAGASTGQ